MKRVCEELRSVIPSFPDFEKPWEIIDHLRSIELKPNMPIKEVTGLPGATVYCGNNVEIQPYSLFTGEVILCDDVRIGPFCFIRGPVVVGKRSMIGPHSEIIRTVIQTGTTLAHKNLIGDSIIGKNCNLAGFTTICNFSGMRKSVKAHYKDEVMQYEDKYGAYIGDNTWMGALTILMPGAYVKPNSEIIGQCVVYGNTKIRQMTTANVEEIVG